MVTLVAEYGIPYGTGSGRQLHLDILRPETASRELRPAIVWVHGGGWREGDRADAPNGPLAERGFVTASISYRFSDEATFPAQIHDVKAAIRFLRANAGRWSIDSERIGIWGHSAGGHLAALAAVSEGIPSLEGDGGNPDELSDVQAAVPLSAPTDFLFDWDTGFGNPRHEHFSAIEDLLDGRDLTDPAVHKRAKLASPTRLATAGAAPMLVVHGTRDDLVPTDQGRRLVTALHEAGADATLLELASDTHNLESVLGATLDTPSEALHRIVAFFERVLGPVPAA